MCYHTSLLAGAAELARRYGRKADLIGDFRPQYRVSAFTHTRYPIVTADEQIRLFSWGLVPFWTGASDEIVTIRNRTVNARAETVFQKPPFRIPILRKRCLVPFSGFFTWRHEQGRKVPFLVSVRELRVASLAGVFDSWYDRESDRTLTTYSIITTEANELMRRINNTSYRMPVILRPEEEARWLDPRLSQQQIAGLLRPFPAGELLSEVVREERLQQVPAPTALVPA